MDKYTLPLLNSILSIYEIIKLELLPPLDFPKLGQLKIKGFEPSQILPKFFTDLVFLGYYIVVFFIFCIIYLM